MQVRARYANSLKLFVNGKAYTIENPSPIMPTAEFIRSLGLRWVFACV